MFTFSLKRIVVAALLAAAGMVGGCGQSPPTAPPPGNPPPANPGQPLGAAPIVQRVVPNKISTAVQTQVTVYGERFHDEARVTFGGAPASVVHAAATELTLLSPVHAAGTVDIIVTNPDGQSSRLAGGLIYEDAPAVPPVVTTVSPIVVVTTGGAWIELRGTGLNFGTSVTLDGVVVRTFSTLSGSLEFGAPPHDAGPVDLVVSNPYGQASLPGAFTYAPPEAFNFNGTWKGWADGPPDSLVEMSFTIANNALVSVSCGLTTVTLSPPAQISGGAFSFVGEAGLTLKGRMLSPTTATGDIHAPPCSPGWSAVRQ